MMSQAVAITSMTSMMNEKKLLMLILAEGLMKVWM